MRLCRLCYSRECRRWRRDSRGEISNYLACISSLDKKGGRGCTVPKAFLSRCVPDLKADDGVTLVVYDSFREKGCADCARCARGCELILNISLYQTLPWSLVPNSLQSSSLSRLLKNGVNTYGFPNSLRS
jgi:hypothetical protein